MKSTLKFFDRDGQGISLGEIRWAFLHMGFTFTDTQITALYAQYVCILFYTQKTTICFLWSIHLSKKWMKRSQLSSTSIRSFFCRLDKELTGDIRYQTFMDLLVDNDFMEITHSWLMPKQTDAAKVRGGILSIPQSERGRLQVADVCLKLDEEAFK